MAGRTKEWEDLINRLESAFKGNSCKFLVLVGDYGIGKTFTVERLYSKFKKRQLGFKDIVVARTTLAGAPIRASPTEPASSRFGADLVNRVFGNIGLDDLRVISAKPNLDLRSVSKPMASIMKDIRTGGDVGFRTLAGEAVSYSELKELGLKPLRDSPTALSYLSDFLRILRGTGYSSLLLILDEFEYVMNFSSSRVTVILNTFREIFDSYGISESREPGKLAKLIFLFAISPGGWEALQDLERSTMRRSGGGGIAPFFRRVSPIDVITLLPLSVDETVELLKIRLSAQRETKPSDPVHPFTLQAARRIGEIGEGVPSKILDLAGIVLDVAGQRGFKKIDSSEVEEILGELNLYSPRRRIGRIRMKGRPRLAKR